MSTPHQDARKRLPAKPSVENLKKQAKRLVKDQPSLSLQQAQHQLAKSYGFVNWNELLDKIGADPAAFFKAIDAGDTVAATKLLTADPRLVRARRERRSDGPPGVRWGATALHLAARQGNPEMVKLLVERGADLEAGAGGTDIPSRATPLLWAAAGGHFEVVQVLTERGADVNADADAAPGAVDAQSRWNDPRIAEYLLQHGASITIFAAVALQKDQTVRQMVENRPSLLNARLNPTKVGFTPLHLAARRNLPGMIDLLLDLGAPGNARDRQGRTAADVALCGGRPEAYERLIAHDLKASSKWMGICGNIDRAARMDRFLWACGGNPTLVQAMLQEDPSLAVAKLPNLWPDNYCGATALHFAAWSGQQRIARELIGHGADPAAKDERYGGTPSGWAKENHQK